ncbi:MAG: PSP1 domain-containing protein [Eubacteriales bacterium]
MDDADAVEVVGVRFKRTGKVYYFAPGEIHARCGDHIIVETARGLEYGEVCMANKKVASKDIVLPLRPVIRLATPEDTEHHEQNKEKEKEAFDICLEKIAKHGLDMKLVDAQYTFDNTKLLFYFTAPGRVDFRELVRDLASVFRTRIELRQIGIRDEAKLIGGIGVCGRKLCCSSFLSDFVQVSIRMAKEQNLSLNSNKISGVCGRLMCCLRYEYDTYVDEIKKTPPVDSVVRTEDGEGVVTEVNPLAGTVKVRLSDKSDLQPKSYSRDNITVIIRPQNTEKNGINGENSDIGNYLNGNPGERDV